LRHRSQQRAQSKFNAGYLVRIRKRSIASSMSREYPSSTDAYRAFYEKTVVPAAKLADLPL
jgi:hypothetical protein